MHSDKVLSETAIRLLDNQTYAALATVNPDGAPQTSVIWAKRDGDDVLFSTILGRRKTMNMQRHPAVSILLVDPKNHYAYAEIRGDVSISEEGGDALINELSLAYTGKPWVEHVTPVTRVVCRVKPNKVLTR